MTLLHHIELVLFIVTSLILTVIVLLQSGRGRGVAGIFGGSGGDTVLGSKTADVLTWITIAAFAVFLLLAIALHLTH